MKNVLTHLYKNKTEEPILQTNMRPTIPQAAQARVIRERVINDDL